MHKEKKSKNVKGCFPPKTSTLNTEKGFKGRFNYLLRTAKMMWMTSINLMQNITYGVCNKLLDIIPQFHNLVTNYSGNNLHCICDQAPEANCFKFKSRKKALYIISSNNWTNVEVKIRLFC